MKKNYKLRKKYKKKSKFFFQESHYQLILLCIILLITGGFCILFLEKKALPKISIVKMNSSLTQASDDFSVMDVSFDQNIDTTIDIFSSTDLTTSDAIKTEPIFELNLNPTIETNAPKNIQKQIHKLLARTIFSKKHKSPQFFIVIDDIGYSLERAKIFLDIKEPITFAVLPNLPQSAAITDVLQQYSKPILLHMPMEPIGNRVLETVTLLDKDTSSDIQRKLKQSLKTIGQPVGINNHMGSSFTKNFHGMDALMQFLKSNNLFFLDSKTVGGNLSKQLAEHYQVSYYARDIFLDNSKNHLAIAKQLIKAAKIAFNKGSSVAIGHPYKQTYQVLVILIPQLTSKGIQFQYFSAR